jgi:UDP-N-acetylmuramyl pentapeptide phosphotransferase/UDP-N-acetylglucosamine-1-phosphate transferase
MASGLLLCLLTGLSLTHINVWGADWLLGFWPVSVAFSAFAIGGMANAINIIDGFNGLATGTLMIAFFSISVIAQKVGDLPLAGLCILMQAAVLGFGVVNFPLGKIFLGDSGAYIGGVMLAWVAILLPVRNPGVSAWASLLACGYPVIEVLFSMARKHHREGHRPAQPDKVHLHMLLHSRFARRLIPSADNAIKNSLTSLFLWAYAAVPAFAATRWFSQTPRLMVAFLVSAGLYWIIYLRLTQFRWCLVPSTTRNVTALPLS